MKKHCFLIAALFILLVSVGCSEKRSEDPSPDQTLQPVLDFPEGTSIKALAEGGTYELTYTIENPVEGVLAELVPEQAWISNWKVAADKISVTVEPNDGNEDRKANIYFTYRYGEDEEQVLEEYLTVYQVYRYDYDFEAQSIYGGFFKDTDGNSPNYSFYLSDIGLSEDAGSFLGNGTYYRFDVNIGKVPEDYSAIVVPEGTYSQVPYVLTGFYGKTNADASDWAERSTIEEFTLTVVRDGEEWLYEALATDENGKVHHVTFKGPVSMNLFSKEGKQLINWDVQLREPVFLTEAKYMSDVDGVMQVRMQITGTPEDEDWLNPWNSIYFEMYMPMSQDSDFPEGTWTVSTDKSPYTMYPGYIDENLTTRGTFAHDSDGLGAVLALISDGTVTVGRDGDVCTVVIDVCTAEGFSVKGTYVGELELPNIPGGGFSTLDEDYTVRMDEINYTYGSFWGDDYGTGGGYYELEMSGPFEQDPDEYQQQGTGESVFFALVTNSLDFDDGIVTGTYTVAQNPEAPQPGEFLPGTRGAGANMLYGTYYVGAYEAGQVSRCAPAVSGELNVVNHGEGMYTFEFSFRDGKGHTWDGEWTGEFPWITDWTAIYGIPERRDYVSRREVLETDNVLSPKSFPIL